MSVSETKNILFEIANSSDEPIIRVLNTISIFEIISILGLFFVAATAVFAAISIRDGSNTRRAEFSFRVWQAFTEDAVQSVFHEIDWGRFKYPYNTETKFETKEQEIGVDKLLYLLDELALLIELKVLSKTDRERWEYQGRRVYECSGIVQYISFLDSFYRAQRIKKTPHAAGRRAFSSRS